MTRFSVAKDKVDALGMKDSSGQILHDLLGQISVSMSPVPGLSHLILLAVGKDGTVKLLHLIFYIPIGVLYIHRCLFDFDREIPESILSHQLS